ncbi:sensor domain-containing diguanylate cyclase [[Enterobacter] lignolyticus]|uniref:diguanylate cyclase n=1 Tax=[Enterobacter] lignolyticus TaxID=1334193 RepID=A0A806X3V3_9ENTR|nr:sensor domain-containing diguanylate cyclase [[Enterobacter] lignolyticus]ALR76320.1 hypothetical protein AO703_08430 [[Enterobacter] lignolyticus]
MLLSIVLCAILIIANVYLFDDVDVMLIPRSGYLMNIIVLCFIDAIAFIFAIICFIADRKQFSMLILSLSFLSNIFYYIEMIIAIQSPTEGILSVQMMANDISIFYFFRQLSLVGLLVIALVTTKISIEIKSRVKMRLIILSACFLPLIVLPVVAHNLSSYNSAYSLIIADYIKQPSKAMWEPLYINILVVAWSVLLCAIIMLNKLSSDIWNSVIVISVSAIICNLFFQLLDNNNLSIWYMSRAVEIFGKIFVVAILTYHALKLTKVSADASFDNGLTAVYNRKYFFSALKLISENKVHPGFCVMAINVDNLKRINEIWGSQASSRVTLAVVENIKKNIQHDDILARLTGQIFGVILYTASAERSALLAEKIRADVERYAGEENAANIPGPITVSIGALYTADKNCNAAAIGEMACRALYEAKRTGGNKVVLRHSGH